MAAPIRPASLVAPKPRVATPGGPAGYFYPREIVEILGCPELDYHQLRRMFLLARYQFAQPATARTWSRYTLRDVAAVRQILELAGGRASLAPGRRLIIAPVEVACEALLAAGIRDPLLEVVLERQGRRVFAVVNGSIFEPASGQGVLRDVFADARAYLKSDESDVLANLRGERDRRLRQVRQHVQALYNTA